MRDKITEKEKARILDAAYSGRIYSKIAWKNYILLRKASFHGAVFFHGSRLEFFETLDGDMFMARWTSEDKIEVEVFPSVGGRLVSSGLV